MAGLGPAPLPHIGLLLDVEVAVGSLTGELDDLTCVGEGNHTEGVGAPAYLPSMSLVMYDAGILGVLGPGGNPIELDALTVVGAAEVVVAGTTTKTLGALTVDADGTAVFVQGSIDAPVSLPHLAGVLFAYGGPIATLNQTLEDATLVSEVDAPGNEIWAYDDDDGPARAPIYWPHAYNVDWFQTDTVLRSDTGGIFGVVGQNLQPITATLTGAVSVDGALAKTFDALTAVSTGTVDVTGTVTKTLSDLTCDSDANVLLSDIIGTLDITLDAMASSGTIEAEVSGTLTQTLANMTSDADATNEVSGTLDKTLQGINANIDGSVLNDIVCVVNQFLEDMICRARAEGPRRDKDAGGTKGKKGKKPRVTVEIDGETFEVSNEEEAKALLQEVSELAQQTAKAAAAAAIDRFDRKTKTDQLDSDPDRLNTPEVTAGEGDKSENLALRVQAELDKAYHDAQLELERAIQRKKQAILDEEESLVLMLLD